MALNNISQNDNLTMTTSTTNASSFSPMDAACLDALNVIMEPYAQVARSLFMFLQFVQFSVFIALIRTYRKSRRLAMHGNLKLLYFHQIIIYQLAIIGYPMAEARNIILSIFYSASPCSLMIPIWYILISRGPIMIYTYAIPFFHFAIMFERYRATKLVENYEYKGNSFGISTLVLIYTLALAMTAAIMCLFLSDNQFNLGKKLSYNTAVSNSNGALANIFTLIQMSFVLLAVIGDCWVSRMNKILRRQRIILNYTVDSQQIGMYNLSKNYQLHENYIAMRIILPLDIAYLFFILIFNILVILLRNNRLNMSLAIFLGHYNMLSCLLTLYTIISLCIYRDFLLLQSATSNGTWLRGKKRNARANNIVPMEQIGQLYFNQLKHQWEDCAP